MKKNVETAVIIREIESAGCLSLADMSEMFNISIATLRMQLGKIDRVVSYRADEVEMYKILEVERPKFLTKPLDMAKMYSDVYARATENRAIQSLYAKLN